MGYKKRTDLILTHVNRIECIKCETLTSFITVVCIMLTNFAVIIFLPLISQDRANDGAGVLDHHLANLNVPFAEKATAVNFRSKKDLSSEDSLSIQNILDINHILCLHCHFLLPLPVNPYCLF